MHTYSQERCDSSELTLLMFESSPHPPAPMRLNPFYRPTHTQTNAHWRCSITRPLPLKLERTLLALARVHTGSSRRGSRDIVSFATNQLTTPAPGYSITCGDTQLVSKRETHAQCFFLPKQPPPPNPPDHFNGDLIKTTFTRLLSSHDFHPSVCSLSVMKSVNNV